MMADLRRVRFDRYEAFGSVRGSCGHVHRTAEAAQACADRDRRACRALGGGANSDRAVRAIGNHSTQRRHVSR